jgi:hypothetical protein
VRQIAHELLRDRRPIVAEIVSAIEAQVGEYALPHGGRRSLADLAGHCDAHVAGFVAGLLDGTPAERLDLSFVEATVVRRVGQGIPLEAILHAFRIGHQVFWSAVIEHAERVAGGRAAAVAIVQPSISYVDAVSTRVAEVYLREQQRALAEADRIGRDLLELVLADGATAGDGRLAGVELDPHAPHHVLLATVSPAEDLQALRVLAQETSLAFAPAALLVVVRHHTVTALLRGQASESTAPAERVVRRCASRLGATPRVGISLTADGLAGVASALEQAEAALRVSSYEAPVVALGRMPALDYLIADADETARALVPAEVRALAASRRVADAALVQTLAVYLACGLNVRSTAAALPAHPNTVHDRLRRLGERTGYDVRDAAQLMRLTTELRLCSLP